MSVALMLAAALAVAPGCDLEAPDGQAGCAREAVDQLPVNALQAVGTHNSYKLAIPPPEMALLRAMAPEQAQALDYAHAPLSVQLAAGARQLEIDVLNDPDPGRYARPLGLRMTQGAAAYDTAPLTGPGLKVLHVQDIDYRSSCPLFTGCLAEVAAWSKANPDHVPLLILLNLKEGQALPAPGAVTPAPSTPRPWRRWTPRSAACSLLRPSSHLMMCKATIRPCGRPRPPAPGRAWVRPAARSCSPSTLRAVRWTSIGAPVARSRAG